MMYQKKITNAIDEMAKGNMAKLAVVSGIAALAAIVAIITIKSKYFANSKMSKSKKAKQKLGSLIEDVRYHVKQNAAGLLERSDV